jgi:hypothetical protein
MWLSNKHSRRIRRFRGREQRLTLLQDHLKCHWHTRPLHPSSSPLPSAPRLCSSPIILPRLRHPLILYCRPVRPILRLLDRHPLARLLCPLP